MDNPDRIRRPEDLLKAYEKISQENSRIKNF